MKSMDRLTNQVADLINQTPLGSDYKINPDLNMHIEAITFQNFLKNVEKRMSPFFDHLFVEKV